ncbi:MAG: phosphate/phosphite/phosphonate ABC transporter substrate-binding protein [Chromatiales bacterium]|nr:phosphate/phosphite/phosphonate ABC transporter substrate-binding protein [Chromatiales bacterium]
MFRKTFSLIIFFSLLTTLAPNAFSEELKLGVLAPRGELKANARWQDFGQYLSSELGKTVTIVPLPPARVTEAVNSKKVDFLLSHSPHTVYVNEKLGANVLATLNTKAGPQFGGVIVAKKGSGIKSANDLRGKNVMSLKFKAAAGAYIFQTYHLVQQGIDPHKDFGSLRAGKKQDDLVLAVKNGLIDAAFVRTGLLENMEREGKIKLDEFQIVDHRDNDGFSLLHSTELYPEWCFSALPHVGQEDTNTVKAALFKVTPDMPAISKARIKGFVEPVPLDGIKQALKTLQIAPYSG